MERLGRHVEGELGRVTPASVGEMAAIVRAWPAAVGAENARRAWPARLARDGTLHVNAADSMWAFQLGLLAATVLEQLREHVGAAAPSAIRFAAGPIPEPVPPPREERSPRPPPAAAEDERRGAELAAGIEDRELRATVARAAAASLARARSSRGF